MLNKIKNIFKRKEIDPEVKKQRNTIEVAVYLFIFFVVFCFSIFNKKVPKTPEISEESSLMSSMITENTNESLKSEITKLKTCNYNLEAQIKSDLEEKTIEISSESCDKEVVIKDSKSSSSEGYFRINDSYYILKNDSENKISKSINPNYFQKDYTFLYAKNIIELINNDNTTINYIENKINFTITTASILEVYNRINNTSFKTNNTSSTLTVEEIDNKLIMSFAITESYNIIFSSNQKSVNCIYEFDSIGNIDLKEMEEKIIE